MPLSPTGFYSPTEPQIPLVLTEATYAHFPQHISGAPLLEKEKPSQWERSAYVIIRAAWRSVSPEC